MPFLHSNVSLQMSCTDETANSERRADGVALSFCADGWYMTHAGLSHIENIFYFTNVDTEELSNHELHDVEGDLLTISGGCG